MELTDQCKDYFINWYKEFEPKSDWEYPAYDYFLNHSMGYKISVLTLFFDLNEVFICIDPYIGGGAPVFYGSVTYRNKQNIDVKEDIKDSIEPIYTWNRQEMSVMCLSHCNKVFNEINDPIQLDIKKQELDDLPF